MPSESSAARRCSPTAAATAPRSAARSKSGHGADGLTLHQPEWNAVVDAGRRSRNKIRWAGTVRWSAARPQSLLGQLQIMTGLHPQPEAFAEAEETAQAQIGVGTDRPPPLHDRVDAALRYADRQRQPVLTDPHRSEELLQQHLARMHQPGTGR